ncbi:MAG: serine hydrolase [Planctomycetes bacterium]|nr:serine hydrolase [Planctomycetota bacterium]
MQPILRSAFFPLLLAAVVQAQIAAYHDRTAAQHQAQVAALTGAGYRPISLALYGTTATPQYAAVWVQRNGPAFLPFQDLTAAQYQALLDANAPAMVPTLVTALGTAANPRFSGVLEQTGYGAWAQHGLTVQGMADAVTAARGANWRLRSADVYGTSGDPRFVVTFQPNPQQVGWGYYLASDAQDHQDRFTGMDQLYGRQTIAAFNDDGSQFLSCWEDTLVGGGPIHHDMTSATYDTLANQYWNQDNRYPINVCASGNGSGARFSAIFASTDVPQSRQWTVTGQAVPALAAFDTWVQTFMQQGGVRGAQLAIVKDGELKLARGYTWAEPGYAPITPTNIFRIASCTKPLTSIAIHRAIAASPIAFNYDTTMASMFNNPNFVDPNNNITTIEHLLRHRGGWDRSQNGSNYDPMFIDTTVANAANVSLPITTTQIRQYMQNQPLDFVPDNNGAYSNYGYSLLGRIVERRNPGKTYAQVIDDQIFQPLGITRPRIGGAHRDQRLPGEVLYHPLTLSLARSVNDADQPFVPRHYGGWNHANMDSHGAYVMAAADFAKVLAAFDLGVFNPILHPTQTAAMWDQTGTSGTLQGWFLNTVGDGVGGTLALREHNGILPGTRAYVGRREDGISFVLFTNGDRALGGTEGEELSDLANLVSAWPQHDLFGSVGVGGFQQIDDLASPFGNPCPGSTGTARFTTSGGSMIGERLQLELTAAAPNALAFCAFGFERTVFDLTAAGAPGCVVLLQPAATQVAVADRGGSAATTMQFPLEPSLVGAHLLAQWVVVDAAANSLGLAVSSGMDVQVGGWLGF